MVATLLNRKALRFIALAVEDEAEIVNEHAELVPQTQQSMC